MKNVALKIQYNGYDFIGWQKQKAPNSIQEIVENAIYSVTGERVDLYASGRTDAKVNALGQVANFNTNSKIITRKLKLAINAYLPDSIRIIESVDVPDDFNARFSAVSKTYVYLIDNSEIQSPFLKNKAFHHPYDLDFDKFKYNLELLKGTYDFTSLCSVKAQSNTRVRTIYKSDIKEIYKDVYAIELNSNGFLYNMVRIIVGTILDISSGKINCSIDEIIEKKDRTLAGRTIAPYGLYLKKVYYDREYFS